MKLIRKLALVTTLFLTGCAIEPSISQEEIDLAKKHLKTNYALESYMVNYVDGEYHKAWARSKRGRWAWSVDRFSQQDAVAHALKTCRDINKKHEKKYPCKVINLDGKWIAE